MTDKENKDHELDHALFEDRSEHYDGVAFGYCKNFIANTDRHTLMAYYVCQQVEANKIHQPDLSRKFPKRKRDYARRRREADKKRYPFNKKIKELEKEITALTGAGSANIDDAEYGSESSQRIRDLKKQIEDLKTQRKEIKTASYRHQYSSDNKRDKTKVVTASDWRYLHDWFEKKEAEFKDHKASPLYKNLQGLCDYLNMTEGQKELTMLLLCRQQIFNFKHFVDEFSRRKQKGYNSVIGKMINERPEDVAAMLREDSPLVANGIIVLSEDGKGLPTVSDRLIETLSDPEITLDQILKRMIGDAVTTDLDWDEDFSHLGTPGEKLVELLKGAQESNASGINIMLFGVQDSGKTEAVKAVCKKLGLELYSVGEKKDTEGEPSREDRISKALLAQSLLADQPNAAILFDEMEDVLPSSGLRLKKGSGAGHASKIYLNRMLERNKTITFWTANDVDRFHPAVQRRMRFSIEFRIPPARVRENMWKSISAKNDFDLAAEDCRRLGQQYRAPPGMIATAVKNAKLAKDGLSMIETSLKASANLVFARRNAMDVRGAIPDRYDLSLLNAKADDQGADLDIEALTDEIVQSGHRDISMLFYGPPGTGKSAYVRHLAELMGLEVLFVRASDLISPYVGETEQNIARAFMLAEETQQFLIIDEADSLIQDRGQAEKSWEVTRTNEMLTWLENHPYPVAFTTNMTDNLDPASKRRFVFKIKCDYMTQDQSRQAFKKFFEQVPPSDLAGLDMLTPGDFANVRRQLKFRKNQPSADEITALLRQEVSQKNESKSREAGFMASWREQEPEMVMSVRRNEPS